MINLSSLDHLQASIYAFNILQSCLSTRIHKILGQIEGLRELQVSIYIQGNVMEASFSQTVKFSTKLLLVNSLLYKSFVVLVASSNNTIAQHQEDKDDRDN